MGIKGNTRSNGGSTFKQSYAPLRARRAWLLSLAACTAGGVSGLVRNALAMAAVPVKPGVQRVTGSVEISGRPARRGMPVQSGDTVVTGRDAQAIYVIGEDAYLQRADSRVRFDSGTLVPILRVLSGRLLSVFGKGRRDIAIPAATIGIRGTGCYTEVLAQRSYFCLCYGTAAVIPENGRSLEYSTEHHENPLWIENGMVSRAGVINHTDAELVMLEELVGRWPPFYGARDYSY